MPPTAPALVVIEGADAGRRIALAGERLVIGRAPTCDFVLTDPAASREHATVERAGDTVTLRDLGSVNGTFVEGVRARVTTHALRDGDEIVIGRTRFRVELPAGDATVVGASETADATVIAREGGETAAAPVLTIVAGAGSGRSVTLGAERLVIGRAPTCDLVLADAQASRRHAALEAAGDALTLVDLGSANGTFVEGVAKRIGRHALRDGDQFMIGTTRLRISMPAAAIAAAPPTLCVHRAADLAIVLTVLAGPDRGMVYSPTTDVITIGRLASADVPLSDPAASRQHATIKREGSGYAIYDEQSQNGTEVGSPPEAVASAPLKSGDTIRIGETEIRVDVGTGSGAAAIAEQPGDVTVMAGTVGDKTFTMSLRGLAGRTRTRTVAAVETAETAALPTIARSRIVLRVAAGPDKGAVFEPAAGTARFSVGRGARATYRLGDGGVSSVHFTIVEDAGAFTLSDEASRNGTFLGASADRVTTVRLVGGELIRVGASELHVEILAPAAPAEMEDRTVAMTVPGPRAAAPAGAPPAVSPVAAPPVMGRAAAPPAPAAGSPAPQSAAGAAQAAGASQPAAKPARKPKPADLVPELARSAAAKERISRMMKGVSLRPVRTPGTPRQWAGLGCALFAALVSLGFAFRSRTLLSAGPVHEGHATIEERCETCHVAGTAWTSHTTMNGGCVTADCHAKVLKIKPEVRDDCISCHTEHRGRTFPIAGGERLCWGCHAQDYQVRLMQLLVSGDTALKTRLAERLHPTEIGLKFSHPAHDKETRGDRAYDTCTGCHPATDAGRTFRLPGHAECLECHPKAVSADIKVAQAKAGPGCLECHTSEDGHIIAPPARAFGFVVFSHRDHTDDDCKRCHAPIWAEGPYKSVVRTTDLYPVAMDACHTCHQQRGATVACLDCHREHHSFPADAGTPPAAGAAGAGGFNGFLLVVLTVILGAFGYTYADMRFARRWLEEPAPPPAAPRPAAGAAPGSGTPPPTPAVEVLPFPKVDLDACISCSGCYGSCPKEVLAGDDHGKSTVVNPNSCIALEGCRVCEQGCPTGAIRVTTAPLIRTVERPEIDDHNEAKVPGLFFVGEVIGAALIKSAINQGHQAVSYIAEKKPRVADVPFDVIVVGAGPAGLGAALEAKRRGLRYLVLERDTVASTIRNYPRDKAVLAEPVKVPLYGMLPMMDAEKDTLIDVWTTIVTKTGLEVREFEEVTAIERTGGLFHVKTTKGAYDGACVVLAIGTRGNPRKLGAAGEDPVRVSYNLIDAAQYRGKHILVVVGGGDSAIEAAVALGKQPGTKVVLSYRKGGFSRLKKRNQTALDEMVAAGSVELVLNSIVREVRPGTALLEVEEGEREVACDHVFALIGADPPREWIETLGVKFVTREEQVVAW